MSGSGGGGSRSTSTGRDLLSGRPEHGSKGGQNGGASGDPCDITEVTTLNSPDRTVLATLRDGDVLDIELQEGRRLLAKHGTNVAGSVTRRVHPQATRASCSACRTAGNMKQLWGRFAAARAW